MSEEYIERRMHELRKLGKDHADEKPYKTRAWP